MYGKHTSITGYFFLKTFLRAPHTQNADAYYDWLHLGGQIYLMSNVAPYTDQLGKTKTDI